MRIINFVFVASILMVSFYAVSAQLDNESVKSAVIIKQPVNNTTFIAAAISEQHLNWVASKTYIADLPQKEFQKMLGAKPSPDFIANSKILPQYVNNRTFPSSFDWRSNKGDWTTPIRNQGSCGSCWAFATLGAFESRLKIKEGNAAFNPDLSEQYLVSCANLGGCDGAYISSASKFIQKSGIPDESQFPYKGVNQPCISNQNYKKWYSIKNYSSLHYNATDNEIKDAISRGPVIAVFSVYDDFAFYFSGVYEHSWGNREGYHAVDLVGWGTDNRGTYWIAKNSWGRLWGIGEGGWFKIRSGNCGINNEIYEINPEISYPVEITTWTKDNEYTVPFSKIFRNDTYYNQKVYVGTTNASGKLLLEIPSGTKLIANSPYYLISQYIGWYYFGENAFSANDQYTLRTFDLSENVKYSSNVTIKK